MHWVFTGVTLLESVIPLCPFSGGLVFHGKRGEQKARKEGTKAKCCFAVSEMGELPFPMAKQWLYSANKKRNFKEHRVFSVRAPLAGCATGGDLGRNHKPLDRNPTLNLHNTFVWKNSRNVCICIEGKKKNEAWSTAWGYVGSKAGAFFLLQAGREGSWAKCFSHSRSVIFKTHCNSCPCIGRQTAIRLRFVIIYGASSVNQGRSLRRIYSRMSGFA